MKLIIVDAAYHRNGVGGDGFCVALVYTLTVQHSHSLPNGLASPWLYVRVVPESAGG